MMGEFLAVGLVCFGAGVALTLVAMFWPRMANPLLRATFAEDGTLRSLERVYGGKRPPARCMADAGPDPFLSAHRWRCSECGERADPCGGGDPREASRWRWNGTTWEHFHGYPTGHVAAVPDPGAQ